MRAMRCVHCGTAATEGDLYCAGCGQAFIPDLTLAGSTALGTTSGSRNWALAAHVSAIAGALTGGLAAFVGPLVVWVVRRDDTFAAEHARQALNFNLSVLLYVVVGGVASVVLGLVTLGLALLVLVPAAIVAVVAYFVVSAVAAVRASRGRPFRYPFALPLVR